MMKSASLMIAALACAGLVCTPSFAQTGDTPAAPKAPRMRDCSKSPKPDRCEARHAAYAACKDKPAGSERRACVKDQLKAKAAASKS